ncbi:hypothetical protein SAMN05216184_10888 [Georgenia satyanarayanai]|uniref:Uncharacterized protein n=1 Tax=Georgenia satyanarayanai TaxID=860221 RepID=A0A2Y9AFT5_9MICO|nr:hypothetical protein [Georgenia satyanarayanai]PYF99206.1 hypothetical protein A8987_10888 [Georgenia satyanarayanai]SSA43324.1 hypothetical protein SAMN05216184_10888 [Georgenia satyanarayanai]
MAARETGSTTSQGSAPGGPQGSSAAGRESRKPQRGERSRLGWIAITVAGLLTAWQVVYAITVESVANRDTYESIGLMLVLVLAVGSLVLGIVALAQRVLPRWPAVAALAVGVYAFIVAIAGWIGRLMY